MLIIFFTIFNQYVISICRQIELITGMLQANAINVINIFIRNAIGTFLHT